jgi:predicted metal-dependent phosphoesterase TrpH
MNSAINLHIHTTHSDGGNTPAEVVAMLEKAGVTVFAITDHDQVEGNAEAAVLAGEHGLTHINGIELSCCFADGEIGFDESWVAHILGFGFDLDRMRSKLEEMKIERQNRIHGLLHSLASDGYNIELEQIAGNGKIPTRNAIAKILIDKGYAGNVDECYEKILNAQPHRQYAKNKPTIQEGIKIIHDCGGIAIWAHPFGVTRGGKKELKQDQISELLMSMMLYGLDGIEVFYQGYTPEQISWLNGHAERFNFFKTVGTDYHNTTVDLLDYPEYAKIREGERIAFDVVEPDAGAVAMLRKMINPDDDEASYPNKNFHTYKKYHFQCKECDWEGLGDETAIVGDVINYEVIGCPKCRKMIEFIPFPTSGDVLRYGNVKDRRKARRWLVEEMRHKAKWRDKWRNHPDLTSPDQLPDINSDEIIITLREEGLGKVNTKGDIWEGAFLVFYWGRQEIWRVPMWFEYYTGYLRWGEILKEKYGGRLIDFEAAHTVDLGGDSLSAFKKVDEFRAALRANSRASKIEKDGNK